MVYNVKQMEYEFLKYFITEPIYLVEESDRQESGDPLDVEEIAPSSETTILRSEPEAINSVNEPVLERTTHKKPPVDKTNEDVETKVLVFVRYPYIETLPTNEKELLEKILVSADIAFKDITLINLEYGTIPVNDDLTGYTHILIFDNEPATLADLGLKKENYIQQYSGSVHCIVADPLESIYEDTTKKTRLWEVLKTVFNIES